MKKNMAKKGFTLIELIIVIAILGILAMVAIPKFANYRESARISADIATAKTLASMAAVEVAEGTADASVSDNVVANLDSGTMPVAQLKKTIFVITVSSGDITVTADGDEVYPTPAGAYTPDNATD